MTLALAFSGHGTVSGQMPLAATHEASAAEDAFSFPTVVDLASR